MTMTQIKKNAPQNSAKLSKTIFSLDDALLGQGEGEHTPKALDGANGASVAMNAVVCPILGEVPGSVFALTRSNPQQMKIYKANSKKKKAKFLSYIATHKNYYTILCVYLKIIFNRYLFFKKKRNRRK